MTDKEFIQLSSIAAMQGLLAGSPKMIATDLIGQSVGKAELLLSSLRKNDDNKLEDCLAELTDFYERQLRALDNKVGELEYKLGSVIRICEENCPGWINTPVNGMSKSTYLRGENEG